MSKVEETSTAIAKAAAQDPSISDYRKSSKSFGVISRGLTVENVEQACSAVAFDLITGKLDLAQTAALCKLMDITLKKEDQVIQREQMAFQIEMRKTMRIQQKARRELVR